MKKAVSLVLCLCVTAALFMPISAVFADYGGEYTEGDWRYSVDNGHATIMNYTGDSNVIVFPSSLGGYPVTDIGVTDTSYYHESVIHRDVISVTIPDSVIRIGNKAFQECSITSITIPDSVRNIGMGAFLLCEELEQCRIGNNVVSIGDYAFSCTSLTSIVIPDSVSQIGEGAFGLNIMFKVIGADLGDGGYVIEYENKLTNVSFGKGLVDIGDFAFEGAPLISVTIPEGVTQIGNGAFANCNLLEKVYIKGSPKIGERAFSEVNGSSEDIVPLPVTLYGKIDSSVPQYAANNGLKFEELSQNVLEEIASSLASPLWVIAGGSTIVILLIVIVVLVLHQKKRF